MSRFFSHLPARKRFLLLVLPVLAAVCAVLYAAGFPITEERKFRKFTEEVFCAELGGNTLNLHYTVANPAAYHLDDCAPTLGDASLESRRHSAAACENYLAALKEFHYEKLTEPQQLTYDIFKSHLETELSASRFLLYDEPLSPTLGVQAQLPILFAEYPFRTKGDIEDYLALLTQMPDYFSSLLSFERSKAAEGLFMSDENARAVIRQCRNFIAKPEENYLLELFREKIDACQNLSQDEKTAYQTRNQTALTGYVIPAYEALIDGIEKLLGSGKNEMGLCYYPQGGDYYEYLVHSITGDNHSLAEIEAAIKKQLTADFSQTQKLLQMQKNKLAVSGSLPESADPVQMLQDLRQKITRDFPVAPAVSCEVKYVPDSLRAYLSPAFYLTPAIDSYTKNVIYINPASHYQGLTLYTTLAHEGYPGHLYQSVCFNSQSPDLLRCILDVGGYTEGWATYVEMYSYLFWQKEPLQAALAQKNRSFSLGLASLLDIGIHCHGYSLADVSAFLTKLGFDPETAHSLYQSILQSPANYLQYYVGYLNFLALRDAAKQELGSDFSLKNFHQAVLTVGPAPFDILKRNVFRELGIRSAG